MDHSLESDLVFQSQSREPAEATINIYEDILAQQIDHIGTGEPSKSSAAGSTIEAPPTMDQEADTVIVNPLKTGAVNITSTSSANMDFLLITQLRVAVKPLAYRMAAEVTGSHDIESLAFRNPDGTRVLFTVNHSESPISLEVFWKDRLFPYSQTGNSIALFAWNPKGQLVSLVAQKHQGLTAEDTLSLEATCLQVSPLGITLRCESPTASCSIFPVYFTCDSGQNTVPLIVTIGRGDKGDTDSSEPAFVTITAAPDVGGPTSLRVSSVEVGR